MNAKSVEKVLIPIDQFICPNIIVKIETLTIRQSNFLFMIHIPIGIDRLDITAR